MIGLIAALVIGLLAGGVLAVAAATVWPYQRRFVRSADRTAFVLTAGASGTIGLVLFGLCGMMLLFICCERQRSAA
jgi:hypothetical protein